MSVVAHMTNSKGAVNWAVRVGANGVEMDLTFKNDGTPKEFYHGGVCDCTCICPWWCDGNHVCAALQDDTGKSCNAYTPAYEMAAYLGSAGIRDKLAIIYIDAKLGDSVSYYVAGGRVVDMLNANVFKKGYKGMTHTTISR